MEFQTPPVVASPIDGGVRLTFSGPIHLNVSWLEGELNKVTATKPKLVEMDLAGTEHISSLGLGLIVGFRNGIKKNGGNVRIVKIRKRTMGILKTATLDRLLEVDPAGIIEK